MRDLIADTLEQLANAIRPRVRDTLDLVLSREDAADYVACMTREERDRWDAGGWVETVHRRLGWSIRIRQSVKASDTGESFPGLTPDDMREVANTVAGQLNGRSAEGAALAELVDRLTANAAKAIMGVLERGGHITHVLVPTHQAALGATIAGRLGISCHVTPWLPQDGAWRFLETTDDELRLLGPDSYGPSPGG